MASVLKLSEEDLAFFRLTCDLFPTPESPLRYFQDEDIEPSDPAETFASLDGRGLLNGQCSGAAVEVRERLDPVSECDARVILRSGKSDAEESRSFYIAGGAGVEYSRETDLHSFGEPCPEADLATELAKEFVATDEVKSSPLRLSSGDYLVFAVFARDVRAQPEPELDDDSPMSVDEVLAFFDEPETNYVPTPSDDSWRRSVETLCAQGVLVRKSSGYELEPGLFPLARQIVADAQRTVLRFDFLDEEWLVREINLYPTTQTVYRLGTQPDGSVVIQELTSVALTDLLAGVVTTLPNILNPDVPTTLKGSDLHARGPI